MRSPHCGDCHDYVPPHWGSGGFRLLLPALYGYPRTTLEVSFPKSSLTTPPSSVGIFPPGVAKPLRRQRAVNITSCRSATPPAHVTGLGFADLVEEPAGLKRNKNPKLPPAVAHMPNVSRAVLIEPEPAREGALRQAAGFRPSSWSSSTAACGRDNPP